MSTRKFSKASQVIAILFMFTLLLPGVQVLADPCTTMAAYCPPDDPGTPDTSITVTPECPEDPTKKKWTFRNWSDSEIEIGWSIAGGESGTLIIPGKEAGEDYYETVLYTDAVEGTNVLDYYDGHSFKESVESIDCPDSLEVVPVCTDVPDKKKWIVRNFNDADISVTWSVYGTDQQGMLTVPGQEGDEPYGEAVFYTDEIEGIHTVIVTGDGETHTAESSDEECLPPPQIEIIPVCTDVAGKNKWIIRYHHDVGTTVTWSVNGDAQTGSLDLEGSDGDEPYSETVLYTDASEDINTLIVTTDTEEYAADSSDEECLPPPPPIDIVPVCTDVKGKNKWIIRHHQDVAVTVTWSVYGDGESQSGTIELDGVSDDEEYSETILYTDATEGVSTLTIILDGEEYVAESSDEECLPSSSRRGRSSGSSGSVTDRTTDDEEISDSTEIDQQPTEDPPGDEREPLNEEQDREDPQEQDDTFTQPFDDPDPPIEEELEFRITEEIGKELPNTATSWYNILFISLLAMAGSGLYLWRKKSTS